MSNNPKLAHENLDLRALVDALGQGIVLFNAENNCILDNLAARAILGANLPLVRSGGWTAFASLLDALRGDGLPAADIRERALRESERPIRFSMMLSGTYVPCWAAAVHNPDGKVYLMITFDIPDWKPLTELLGKFRSEASMSIGSTQGHAELIQQLAANPPKNATVEIMGKRVIGFAEIIATHMYRLQLLMELLQRLEVIRTGTLPEIIRTSRRKLFVAEFIEDFLEETADEGLIEPSQRHDIRERLIVDVPSELAASMPPPILKNVLSDLLRNAIQYSPSKARIILRATSVSQKRSIQIDVIDEGYGVRAKETERVFAPFQRARQPQIIGEFGYGLSLYCAKTEIEAMGGRLWFESEEGVGSTFSFKIPAWREP